MTLDERRVALEALAAETQTCQACALCHSAARAVPGEGPPDAAILFIGEAPGVQEDRQGRPFVGPAGQLLNELLARIGLRRDDVFIANMVKHRPPGNRDPEPDEIAACKGYLDRQIELVNPRVIVTLGRFAMERFMPGAKISQVHGQPRQIAGRTFVPILHPAAALHNGSWRPMLEADFDALGQMLAEGIDAAPAEALPETPEQLSLF
jgi:uracil-DNA glycosylase